MNPALRPVQTPEVALVTPSVTAARQGAAAAAAAEGSEALLLFE